MLLRKFLKVTEKVLKAHKKAVTKALIIAFSGAGGTG